MKLQEVLDKTAGFFRSKGSSSARLDAEILLSKALKIDRIRLYIDFDRPLSDGELESCRDFVRRRGQGEPVAYITGSKDFFALSFKVSSAVLIPRPETEQLVEDALNWAQKNKISNPRIVDLGAGSGCIGLSFLKNNSDARLLSVEFSADALAVARENAEALGVGDRVTFAQADASNTSSVAELLSQAGFEEIDLLLANPPYIDEKDTRVEENVRRFEPAQALFSPEQGLQALQTWTKAWAPSLAPTSFCMMEMGLDQGPQMLQAYRDLNLFSEALIVKDLAGHDRFIKGVRHG